MPKLGEIDRTSTTATVTYDHLFWRETEREREREREGDRERETERDRERETERDRESTKTGAYTSHTHTHTGADQPTKHLNVLAVDGSKLVHSSNRKVDVSHSINTSTVLAKLLLEQAQGIACLQCK